MESKSKTRLLKIVYTAMFVAIIIVCAQIQIPFGQVPFTLQTLGVFIAAAMLGWKLSTIAVFVYALAGFIGLPVFAGFTGGVGIVFGPTGGYIVGFLFTAVIIGLITEKFGKKIWTLAISMIAGMAACYLFGTVWFVFVMKTDILSAILMCVVPYLVADGLKIALASVLVNRLDKVIKL